MGLVYLPGQESESLRSSKLSQTTEQSVMLSGTNTVKKLFNKELKTECLTMPQSGTMCKHSMGKNGLGKWISSLEDSPVNHSLSLANKRESLIKGICGQILTESLAKYDHDTHSWRTYQLSFLTNTSTEYSGTWLKSGMIVNGTLYPLQTMERAIKESVCGFWHPTPTAVCWKMKNYDPIKAKEYVKKHQDKAIIQIQEKLYKKYGIKKAMNPIAYEWMMGYPIMWTGLKPLEMDGFRKWLEKF